MEYLTNGQEVYFIEMPKIYLVSKLELIPLERHFQVSSIGMCFSMI